jgi:DNA-binding MarR family transcriptional regulator
MADRRVFFKLYLAQHMLSKRTDSLLKSSLGIRSVHLGAVFFLLMHDGCMLKELSKGLGLNNSAITGLVDRMEKAELVKREACSVDGRSYRLYLTEKARTLGLNALPIAKELNDRLLQGFTDEEIDTVIRFLDSIISFTRGEKKNETGAEHPKEDDRNHS